MQGKTEKVIHISYIYHYIDYHIKMLGTLNYKFDSLSKYQEMPKFCFFICILEKKSSVPFEILYLVFFIINNDHDFGNFIFRGIYQSVQFFEQLNIVNQLNLIETDGVNALTCNTNEVLFSE